jgi:hypothetical protein
VAEVLEARFLKAGKELSVIRLATSVIRSLAKVLEAKFSKPGS